MAKRIMLVALGICLAASGGCANLHKVFCPKLSRQNESLLAQVESLQAERDALLEEKQALRADRGALESELADAKSEGRRMSQLVGELKGEQERLERQTQELRSLLGDFYGISVEARAEGTFIIMESEILFAPGKAELTEEASASLNKVAEYLLANPDLPIRIDGHTDGVPVKVSPWEDNYHLGAMRAHAVMRYLLDKGVAADRAHIVGFGPNRPRVPPGEPTEPVAENRRVEILLLPEGVRSISEILEEFQD